MKISALTPSALAFIVPSVSAILHNHLTIPQKIVETNDEPKHAFFEQFIDHANPSLGTFPQYYIWSDRHYRGPGSPIVLTTTGEVALTSAYDYLVTTQSIYGTFAKAIGAAVVVLEHRYLGHSSPFKDLTTKNLQYLTVRQAIADFNHFARTVNLPFDPNGTSQATKVPWIFGGGSYPGSLAAWTESTANSTFWAYHATSAPVQTILDFWQYYVPIEENMGNDCYESTSLVIDHVDNILSKGSESEVKSLKKMFMLQDLHHAGDFASALQIPITFWQGGTTFREAKEFIHPFCAWLKAGGNPKKNHKRRIASKTSSKELDKALKGFSEWFREEILPNYCNNLFPSRALGKYNVQCFETYNPNSILFTETAVNNKVLRQYLWLVCNEPLGWLQSGGGHGRPPIVSKFLDLDYVTRQCALYFPEEDGHTYGLAKGKTTNDFNEFTQGWNTRPSKRLLYVNGQVDPWREAGVSSDFRPGGHLNSTAQVPVYLAPEGDHCADFIVTGAPPSTQAIIRAETKQMQKWIAEYPQ